MISLNKASLDSYKVSVPCQYSVHDFTTQADKAVQMLSCTAPARPAKSQQVWPPALRINIARN